MAISNIWRMHSIRFNRTVDVIVGAMNSVAMPTDSEVVREVNSSRLFAYQAHLNFRSASISFTSWDLASLLGEVGLQGECIGTGLPLESVFVNVAQFDCNSIVDFTTYEITKGIVFPTTITVDHQGNAQITYMVIAIFDGTNDPIVKVDSVASGAGNTVDVDTEDLRWTIYETWVGTSQVTKVKSINLDFGIQTSTDGADSEQFDSWVSLDQILPVLTIQGITPDFLKESPTVGAGDRVEITTLGGEAVIGGADVTRVSLKERGNVIATSTHILIDINGLARVTDPFGSSGNDAGRSEIRIEAHLVGPAAANAPIVIQTGVEIPA